MTYIDQAGNLNFATSAATRVFVAGGAQTLSGTAADEIFFGLGGADTIVASGGAEHASSAAQALTASTAAPETTGSSTQSATGPTA